jgi:hypothetical protein
MGPGEVNLTSMAIVRIKKENAIINVIANTKSKIRLINKIFNS